MMKGKPWLSCMLGASLLLSACGADRQTRVDEASSQLVSERLSTATTLATVAATATVAPAATVRPSSTPFPAASPTSAPVADTPATQATAAVPWASKLKRIPGSNDPDGFDYEAPPEVVEAIGVTHKAMTMESLAHNTPELAKTYDATRGFLKFFVEPARSELDQRYSIRERDGYAVNVLRVADSSVEVVAVTADGQRALVEVTYSRYVIDTYYPKSLKFYKQIERKPFSVRLRLAYQSDTGSWRFSHLDPRSSDI